MTGTEAADDDAGNRRAKPTTAVLRTRQSLMRASGW